MDEESSSTYEQEQDEGQTVYTTVTESSSESAEEEQEEAGQHEQDDDSGHNEVVEQQQQQEPVQQSITEVVFADEDGNIIATAPAVVSDGTLYLTVGTREAVSIPDGYFETQALADGFSAASGIVIIFVVFAIFGAVVSRTLIRSFEND